ncbi:serine--tRNA ligase [candidate division KSB3 bacterium]|uniref:Serine--tRNA ligase n=1 Tax=candidate division KSB3 bacterium TaxID=2044937 RepID=A0A2G6E3M4_9BACT|nr:MAG: serine--tRNA ligase [candidate division KSB3 bacterium]PIE29132.1 MAG: serine--tRNA ligase [candidate division KSB3 bacterium]
MLDIKLIRDNAEELRQKLLKRMDEVDFTEVLALDTARREIIQEVEALKARRNAASAKIPALKKEGASIDAIQQEMQEVSAKIKALDTELAKVESAMHTSLAAFPNIPDDDVPAGGKEQNIVLRTWGQKPTFDFEAKDHVELVTSLGMVDYERGVKMGGRGFWLYKGLGAQMEWALLNFFIESHLQDGYEFVLPPHMLTYQCGFTAGQFPKFEHDVFQIAGDNEDGSFKHFILPTAETALINFHRDEVLQEEELPKKYFAYTPCYRREAGSYRTQERGMIRGHQFNKVEMFQFTTPEQSDAALEELIGKAEKLVQELGLHYQVSKLAAKDCSASMAKTYDLEIWIPSMNEYKEVSSASNSREYQPRRGNIRFKRKGAKKPEYIHALNASGLATSRLLPAIVEQFQQADGSVLVPKKLRPWVGRDVLYPQ